MNFKITIHKIIAALVFWQFISVGLMAVGTWPPQVALVNAFLLAIFILIAEPFYSVLLLILSIPFFIALPNDIIPNLPMWRPLFAWLFIVWLIRLLINQRAWLLKFFAIKRWQTENPMSGARLWQIISHAIQRVNSRLRPWDRVAGLFLVLSIFSLLIARFPMHGLKQILFLVNVYLLYVVIVNVVTDEPKLKLLIRYTRYSLMIMVGLGFLQYFSTMFAMPYYFWQYWATMVSSVYYGAPLGNVLSYSNSWFTSSGGSQALRMFGILPDTHAFGVMCIFLLAFFAPFFHGLKTAAYKSNRNKWYWIVALFLVGFGIMASGTRGVWLSMLAPIAVAAFFYLRNYLKPYFKNMLIIFAAILILFVASPLISKGLNFVRTYDVNDNFLDRAGSIYDLSESSNVGRIEIWKHSAQFAALHPFGVGYGNFITSLVSSIPEKATFEQVSAKKNLRYNLPQGFITAHSLYLQLLVELGFAGLLAFILFWWEFFEWLWQFIKRHDHNLTLYPALAVSLGLAFVWLLAYGLFDVTILNDRVLQYLFISLAISGLIFAKYESFSVINSESMDASDDVLAEPVEDPSPFVQHTAI
jgi:O-antigen ligase